MGEVVNLMKNVIKPAPAGYVTVANWFALEAGRCGWSGLVHSVNTDAPLAIHPSAKTAFPQITKSVQSVVGLVAVQ